MGSTLFNKKSKERCCNLSWSTEGNTANVTLRDHMFDREGTKVDIKVHGSDLRIIEITNSGKDFEEVVDQTGNYVMTYKVPGDEFGGALIVDTSDQRCMLVIHIHEASGIFYVSAVKVWYNVWKGRLMSDLTSHSVYYSKLEAYVGLQKTIQHFKNGRNSTRQQKAISGLINNTGGPVVGDLNGSLINLIFNVSMNCK